MAAKAKRPAPPKGMGPAGKALWKSLHDDLPDTQEFTARELTLLEMAARQADDLAALEATIADQGVTATGSQGQERLSQIVTEARQVRLAITRILGAIPLPDDEGRPLTEASHRARRAADARWSRKANIELRRAQKNA